MLDMIPWDWTWQAYVKAFGESCYKRHNNCCTQSVRHMDLFTSISESQLPVNIIPEVSNLVPHLGRRLLTRSDNIRSSHIEHIQRLHRDFYFKSDITQALVRR
jgi:hypothetical protein